MNTNSKFEEFYKNYINKDIDPNYLNNMLVDIFESHDFRKVLSSYNIIVERNALCHCFEYMFVLENKNTEKEFSIIYDVYLAEGNVDLSADISIDADDLVISLLHSGLHSRPLDHEGLYFNLETGETNWNFSEAQIKAIKEDFSLLNELFQHLKKINIVGDFIDDNEIYKCVHILGEKFNYKIYASKKVKNGDIFKSFKMFLKNKTDEDLFIIDDVAYFYCFDTKEGLKFISSYNVF